MASPGRDIKLSEQRIEGYRNFANKIWNAARFVLMNLNGWSLDRKIDDPSLAGRWIRVRLRDCIVSVTQSLETYRFDEAANHLYQFIWHEYCDWYLELIKPRLSEGSPKLDSEATKSTMVSTFETLLRLLHPFMPFITEEIWQKLPHSGESIVVAPYPKTDQISVEDQACEGIMEDIISVIKEIRTIRSELSIPPIQRLKAGLRTSTPKQADQIQREGEADIRRLAGLSEFIAGPSIAIPSGTMLTTTSAGELFVVIEGVDLRKELARVEKKLATAKAELELADQKWKDQEFQRKAPAEVKVDIELRRGKLSEDVFTLSERHRQIKKLLGE
jgi:valyl-tRNA synthetase